MGTNVAYIHNDLDAEIERCRPWLQAALDAGGNTHEIEDLVDGIRSRRYQFWPAEDGAAVTEVLVYPNYRVLHIWLAGGSMDTIVDMDASATEYARLLGCKAVTIAGRRGWKRVLSGNGYQESLTTLVKEISE